MKGTFGLNTCIDTTSCLSANMDFYIVDREHGRASFTEASSLLNAISKNCQKFVRNTPMKNSKLTVKSILFPCQKN